MAHPEPRAERTLTVIYRVFVVVGLIAIIILLLFKPCKCHCACHFHQSIEWDENISWDDESKRIDQQALNDKVSDSMITVSMNANPQMYDKNSEGNFMFENYGGNNDHAGNIHPIVIEVYLKADIDKNDKTKPLYRSGKIPVGAKISSVALNGDKSRLSAGNYSCVAFFNSVNDNDEYIGTAGGECTLHILN